MSSRQRKYSSDSIDSRSHSFDNTERPSSAKMVTKPIQIKRRYRDQPIEYITPSPIPDKSLYFIGFNVDKIVDSMSESTEYYKK